MNTEVEINTTAEAELDDEALWEAVEDNVQRRVESVLEDYEPWDHVRDEVENYCDDRLSSTSDDLDWSGGDEHLQSLLNQLASRTRNGDTLCSLGTSARDAIVAVVKKATETSTLDAVIPSTQERADQVRIDQDLDVQRRIADLERQVKTLLAAIADMGERAASVTPNSVV